MAQGNYWLVREGIKLNLVVVTKQFGNYTGATVSTIQLLKKIAKVSMTEMRASNWICLKKR